MEHIGVYVHIPFCSKKCYYCDFVSYAGKKNQIPQYIEALKKEIDFYDFNKYIVDTIYIGGGTPSFIDSTYIVQILEKIPHTPDTEITIELNPGTVDEDKIKDYKKAGVNRLSIGLQSTDDEVLKTIGRIHSYKQFLETYQIARKVGFKNINIDLMLALPKQTHKVLTESVNKVIKLNPEHVSIYSLILEENTKLKELVEEGKIHLCNDDDERKMYWSIKKQLEKAGYIHYEISNFSKPDYQSRHNTDCWEQKQYIGLGAAAHSFINKVRYSNIASIEEYEKNIEKGKFLDNQVQEEKLTKEAEMNEYMLLGLRKLDGISISKFKEKFNVNPINYYEEILQKLIKSGLIEVTDTNIKISEKGLDLANIVWEEFI